MDDGEGEQGRRDRMRPGGASGSAVPSERAPADGEATIPISAVAEQVGVTIATLRAWQSRYGIGPSRTTPGGHRRYTEADVAQLRSVRHLVERGVPAGDASRRVLAPPPEPGRSRLELPPDACPTAHRIAAAAVELDGPTVRALLRDALLRQGVLEVWETVLRPVLCAAGHQWTELPHGIAVEHLLSHLATIALGETIRPQPREGDRTVLLACAPGELHELPLVALHAALASTRVLPRMIGARTPTEALAAAVDRVQPAAVVILAVTAGLAHEEVLTGLPRGVARIAAGPGWDRVPLPSGVAHVGDLLSAVELVTAVA